MYSIAAHVIGLTEKKISIFIFHLSSSSNGTSETSLYSLIQVRPLNFKQSSFPYDAAVAIVSES